MFMAVPVPSDPKSFDRETSPANCERALCLLAVVDIQTLRRVTLVADATIHLHRELLSRVIALQFWEVRLVGETRNAKVVVVYPLDKHRVRKLTHHKSVYASVSTASVNLVEQDTCLAAHAMVSWCTRSCAHTRKFLPRRLDDTIDFADRIVNWSSSRVRPSRIAA